MPSQSEPTIPLNEFAARRKRLRTTLKNAVGLIFAGHHDPNVGKTFRPHPHFEYLTGITNEYQAALLIDPTHPTEARREVLFLRPLNPETEKWDGYRQFVTKSLRERTGFTTIHRLDVLPRVLTDATRRSKKLACLHPLANYNQSVSPDLNIYQKTTQRIPGVIIEDHTDILSKLRAIKSRHEIAMIQQAIDITCAGFESVVKSVKPGMSEFDVQEVLEHAYRTNGSRGAAFDTIAGAGINSTVLHYGANDQIIKEGDLICLDSGARFGGYGADITRTIPANGQFSKRQREIYTIVLKAEEAAIRAVKPGSTLAKIDAVARRIINDAGFGDFFIHSIGHHLGLETHDAMPDGSLKEGNVITIEPGIYLPDEKIGVRIEDDVVVTKTGCRNLSAKIPKRVIDIERVMRDS